MRHRFFLTALVLVALFANGQETPVYFNPEYSIDDRVESLIQQMTLEEKVSQMVYNSPAIARLNIPAYNWWNERLHGVSRSGRATVFPQAIGLGATFDPDLLLRISTAISAATWTMPRRRNPTTSAPISTAACPKARLTP